MSSHVHVLRVCFVVPVPVAPLPAKSSFSRGHASRGYRSGAADADQSAADATMLRWSTVLSALVDPDNPLSSRATCRGFLIPHD